METTLRTRLPDAAGAFRTMAYPPFAAVSAGATHPGRVRAVNEDAFLERPDLGLWVVADGVGGRLEGRAASHLVTDLLDCLDRPRSAPAFLAEVRERLHEADRLLAPRSSATTVVALLVHSQYFACLWAGDSRLYRLRGGTLECITKDHSEVQTLIDTGLLRPDEAAHHPRAHIITRAVGAPQGLDLDMVRGPVELGDLFLLCSDGLTKVVEDGELQDMLAADDPTTLTESLIEVALSRGGPDNVTVVLVHFPNLP